LKGLDLSYLNKCHVVISVINTVAQGQAAERATEITDAFECLMLDEAHHAPANTWSELRDRFDSKKIAQFTATPFRRDGELVDGKVVYNYPLRKAQQDGYFKKIHFHPIVEPDVEDADRAIAKQAIAQLRKDLSAGMDHILMARCDNIKRADALRMLYTQLAPDLAPLAIYSDSGNSTQSIAAIRKRSCRIVICVDMLGEGFDLPHLKVAAIHDTHKSLAVFLQFAGRLTRTAGDKIGDASAFANIADSNVKNALERLYSEDADWNVLIAELSSDAIREHVELVEFLSDTERIDSPQEDDPTHALTTKHLRPKFSSLVFSCQSFHPKRFKNVITNRDELAGVWINEKAGILAYIRQTSPRVSWSRTKLICDIVWDLVVLYYDKNAKLLFVASSDHDESYLELVRAVSEASANQLSGDRVFRCLGGISRLLLQIVGLKRHGRRALSYSMYSGANVSEALSPQQKASSTKSNVSGSGYENGAPTTVGCSYRGRVWSREQGDIPEFMHWAQAIGTKLNDSTINTDDIIENVLLPHEVSQFPDKTVLCLD